MFVLSPSDIEREAQNHGADVEDLRVSSRVILTFNHPVYGKLKEICKLREIEWMAAKYSPYCKPKKVFLGEYEHSAIHVIVPQMGASAIAALCEELVYFGAKVILLVCASWSLGVGYLAPGEVHVPSFAVGMDGTSPWYGKDSPKINAPISPLKALRDSLENLGQSWKTGGVASHEAIYRISMDDIDQFRRKGCLSMENGETAALFSLAHQKSIPIGVLLQPYIDLIEGWKLDYMSDSYERAGQNQAIAALSALEQLEP
jgi:uridine phosphorylase